MQAVAALGIPYVCLVGNHDRSTKSDFSRHSMSHVDIYRKDLSTVTVLDVVKTIVIPVGNDRVAIHALPAGHMPTTPPERVNGAFNICMFHNLIKKTSLQNGLAIDHDNGLRAWLDSPEFDLVLGGDNHMHQALALDNVPGWYIGAPQQHEWGDVGAKRGYMLFDTEPTFTASHHILNAPTFHKIRFGLTDLSQLASRMQDAAQIARGNILKVIIDTNRELVTGLPASDIENQMRESMGARWVKVLYEFEQSKIEAPPAIISDADLWQSYLKSKPDMKDADVAAVFDLGLEYINRIK
jgi:DNA repair exonuclease SbcCD nuclease subunit